MLNYTIGAVRKKKSTAKKKTAATPKCASAGRRLKKTGSSRAGKELRLCNPIVQRYGVTAKSLVKKKKKK